MNKIIAINHRDTLYELGEDNNISDYKEIGRSGYLTYRVLGEDGETLIEVKDYDEAKVLAGKLAPRKYVVVHDRQGGSFGMGRIYTRKEWAEQAYEWSDTDGAFETEDEANDYQQMLTEMTEQEVIDYIADMWELDFAEHFEYCGKNFAFNVVADNKGEYPFLATVYQLDDDDMPHEVWNDYFPTLLDGETQTKRIFIETIKEGITELRKETD